MIVDDVNRGRQGQMTTGRIPRRNYVIYVVTVDSAVTVVDGRSAQVSFRKSVRLRLASGVSLLSPVIIVSARS